MFQYRRKTVFLACVCFAAYLCFLIYILFFMEARANTYREYNLIPFKSIRMFFEYYFVIPKSHNSGKNRKVYQKTDSGSSIDCRYVILGKYPVHHTCTEGDYFAFCGRPYSCGASF